MLEHVYTNPSPNCRKQEVNAEAKILGPQMAEGIGQFIVSIFAIEHFISVFPKHHLILGKMKTTADTVEATTCKQVDA